MEGWRLTATALMAVGGIVLVLVVMAKVRDRVGGRPGAGGTVALSGAISFTVLVLLCVLTLTVLAPPIAWGAVVVVGVAVSVMLLAS